MAFVDDKSVKTIRLAATCIRGRIVSLSQVLFHILIFGLTHCVAISRRGASCHNLRPRILGCDKALTWWLTSILVGCSNPTPDLPSRVRDEHSSTASAAKSYPELVQRDLRTPTNIRFENCERFPGFTFDNGGTHPQGTILETLGGGVAAIDFDRDGWPDLCFAAGGRFSREEIPTLQSRLPIRLFRNQQQPAEGWDDVTDQASLVGFELFSLGVAAADVNHDGFTDLCVTGYGPMRLYQNQGDGTFLECAEASGLQDHRFTTSAGWGDLNADGVLDLYVCHYVVWDPAAEKECQKRKTNPLDICGPKSFESESDHVFLGLGDGTFRDATTEIGLQPGGKGLGVVVGDVDRDGDVDVYVANDTTANFLYLNDGHGRLEEVGALNGVAYDENGRPTGSMGVALADYDNDGLPDLWTTNFEFEALALYRNMGRAQFHLVSRQAGVTAMHGEYVSWGTAFADFNCDGNLDIVVANGHLPDYVPQERLSQLPFLLVNDGRKRFNFAQSAAGDYLSTRHSARGLAIVDINRDGQLDVVLSHLSEPACVLRNTTAAAGSTLQVTLVGRDSNRDGWGASAVLETSIGSRLQQLSGGGSYLSTSEPVLHWGFPDGTVLQRLTVFWPSGTVQVMESLPKSTEMTPTYRLTIIEPANDNTALFQGTDVDGIDRPKL